jgi:hypothetical protein
MLVTHNNRLSVSVLFLVVCALLSSTFVVDAVCSSPSNAGNTLFQQSPVWTYDFDDPLSSYQNVTGCTLSTLIHNDNRGAAFDNTNQTLSIGSNIRVTKTDTSTTFSSFTAPTLSPVLNVTDKVVKLRVYLPTPHLMGDDVRSGQITLMFRDTSNRNMIAVFYFPRFQEEQFGYYWDCVVDTDVAYHDFGWDSTQIYKIRIDFYSQNETDRPEVYPISLELINRNPKGIVMVHYDEPDNTPIARQAIAYAASKRIPVTLGIIGSRVDTGNSLSWAELKQFASQGIPSINQTYYHVAYGVNADPNLLLNDWKKMADVMC